MISVASSTSSYGSRYPQETRADPASSADQKKTADKPQGLSEEEARALARLRDRDREVRAHEAAHLAVAGSYAVGGINLQMTRGPDGGLYATGGDVQIDVSTVPNDPTATLRKAETIRRAAMAPANPSPQDQRVAAVAGKMAVTAQLELSQAAREAMQRPQAAARYAEVNNDRNRGSSGIDQVA